MKISHFYQNNRFLINLYLIYTLVIHAIPVFLGLTGLTKELFFNPKTYLLDFWGFYWDGAHYIKIAREGYSFPLQAFFPGYPLVLWLLDKFLPFTLTYKINTLLIFPMLFGIDRLMSKFVEDKQLINKSLILFLLFPTAFFLQANYTETLYITLSVWGLYFMFLGKPYISAIFGFLLGLVKITAVVYTFTFFIHFFKKIKFSKLLFLSFITILGILSYFIYLQFGYGSYEYYFKSQAEWGRGFSLDKTPFINDFSNIKRKMIYEKILEVLTIVFGFIVFVKTFKKIPDELYYFSLLHFLIPLSTGTILSINRLILLSFPVLIYFFAQISKNKTIYLILSTIFFIMQFIAIMLFMKGHFLG